MSNELVVNYEWQGKKIILTKADVRNLISTDPKVTDKEIALFMQLCKYQNLNPFVREVYLVKYGTYPASMVVGKEVFTKRAEQNKDFDGYEITDNYTAKLPLEEFEVTCKVFKKSVKHAITVTVSYTEYVGTDSKGNVNRMWKSKPRTMLRKVALMQGLREAFPTALGGLYEENELDQREVPKDITPKPKHEGEAIPMDDTRDNAEDVQEVKIVEEVDRNDEAIEEVEAIEEEKAEQEQGIENDRDREQAEMEGEPASDKQKDFIYGLSQCTKCKKEFQGFKCPYCGAKDTKDKKYIKVIRKGIIHSDYIETPEIIDIGAPSKLSITKASEKMKWWWGDKKKNIVGEREKREKNPVEKPKTSGNALERRKQLMQEVLALMKQNYIHKPMQEKYYKKYQKSEIKELTTEELAELKGELEHFVPDWNV